MKKALILSKSDFHSTFRDPLFKMLLFFPLLSFAIVRYVLPVIVSYYPPVGDYTEVILMWACIQSASMFGMIYGFLFLEEKEESLWQVLRVLPVATGELVFSRLFIGLVVSVFVNYLLIHFGNIIFIPFWKELILAIQFSLVAPLISLLLGVFAKNRIEGLAIIKIVNLLLIVPALIYFIPGDWMHLAAIIPTYWSYRSLELVNDLPDFLIFLSVGFFLYFAAIVFLQKKLFK
ncbi:MAG: hypothetical protein ACNS60_02110 [Candidatus Cyclobacteriaceae bacterium M2_1C_046]